MSGKRVRGASQDFRAAATDTASVGLSLFPLGISFGVLVVHSGLDWWWAPVFTTVIYAGSLEFLLLGLVAAVTPLGQIAATALLVNLRHVFYALSFPLHRVRPPGRVYATFALTDEAYALTAGERARTWSSARILWMQLLCQGYWVGGATVGALAGSLIPITLHGLEFALTALFVVLTIDAWRAHRDLPAPLLAAASFAAAALVTPGQTLPVAMGLFTAGLLTRYALTRYALTRYALTRYALTRYALTRYALGRRALAPHPTAMSMTTALRPPWRPPRPRPGKGSTPPCPARSTWPPPWPSAPPSPGACAPCPSPSSPRFAARPCWATSPCRCPSASC